MNLKKLINKRRATHLIDSLSEISLNEFCNITGWDDKYSSSEGSIRFSSTDSLYYIVLQFYNNRWIYGPRITWRGGYNVMKFPIIASVNFERGVIINNEQELANYSAQWLKGDFSSLNISIKKDTIYNTKNKDYTSFERDMYKVLANDLSIVYMNVYEEYCIIYRIK